MKLKSVLLLTAVALCAASIIWSCKKDTTYVPQLPPETTTGQNTFGCLVNGQVWRNGGVEFPHYSLAIQQADDTSLIVEAYRDNDTSYSGILLYLTNPTLGVEKYTLDSIHSFITYTNMTYKNHNDCVFARMKNGYIQLTRFDLVNSIVSGKFEVASDNDCGYLQITQGRFDLKQ